MRRRTYPLVYRNVVPFRAVGGWRPGAAARHGAGAVQKVLILQGLDETHLPTQSGTRRALVRHAQPLAAQEYRMFSSWRNWLQQSSPRVSRRGRKARPKRPTVQPSMDILEVRCVPATISGTKFNSLTARVSMKSAASCVN
jgi:hypothetical protein